MKPLDAIRPVLTYRRQQKKLHLPLSQVIQVIYWTRSWKQTPRIAKLPKDTIMAQVNRGTPMETMQQKTEGTEKNYNTALLA
jgi:hypothetical protein